jgi:serine protease Do
MVADLAKPGVVQVGSLYTGQVFAYTWGFNNQLLYQDLQRAVDEGDLDPNDPEALDYARTQLFLENPAAYVMPVDEVVQTEVEATMIGSGFIVTPDGYIVTNAHVVATDPETIQSNILEQAVYNFITSDIETIGIQIETEEQYYAVGDALYQFYYSAAASMTIDSSSSSVFVLARYSIPGVVAQTGEEAIPAEVLPHATGEPIPGKDVAIVKIEASNLPTLRLGDDTTLQSLANIIIVGYPAAVSANPVLSPTGQEPTVLTGQFNGYQRTIGGWNAMHVQVPIGHGNSGGPALDSSGRVVGIATFGSIDPQTGEESAGFNYLVPISIVKDFLNRANVQPTDSQFTTMYSQALAEYSVGNYQESLNILQQLNSISPNNPYVINYLSRVQQAAGSSSSSPLASAP